MKNYWTQLEPWILSHGIHIGIILIIAYISSKIMHRIIDKTVRVAIRTSKYSSSVAEVKREDTLINIFNTSLKIVILIIMSMMILQEFGIQIGPMLAAAGVVGLALGFGGQYLIRDLITGLFIILENQYRMGDIIEIDGTGGVVEDISLRKTTLRNLDGTIHHIPHGEIKKVSNLTKDFSRVNLDIGVSYNASLDEVIEVVNQTGIALAEDGDWKSAILKAPQFLRVDDFADSAVMIKIVGETEPLQQWAVAGEFRKRLKIAFDKAGIEIPFPQMVVHQAKPENS